MVELHSACSGSRHASSLCWASCLSADCWCQWQQPSFSTTNISGKSVQTRLSGYCADLMFFFPAKSIKYYNSDGGYLELWSSYSGIKKSDTLVKMHLCWFLLIQYEILMTNYSNYKSITNDYLIKLEIHSNIHFIYITVFKISLFSDLNGIFQKTLSSTTLIIIIHFSWAANQHIWMISGGSCDTEDWINDAENSAFKTFKNIFK